MREAVELDIAWRQRRKGIRGQKKGRFREYGNPDGTLEWKKTQKCAEVGVVRDTASLCHETSRARVAIRQGL